jgi:hypothetical protein
MPINLILKGINMWAMLNQIYAAIAVLFKATESVAQALNNLAVVAEESSAAFADDARITREEKRFIRTQEMEATKAKRLPALSAPVAPVAP